MKADVGATSKQRVYKTGDIVRQHLDGSVTWLGRDDSQFKLNGQRVDVSEIEHHLPEILGHAWQAAVDVVQWEQENRDPSLVCFMARRAGHAKAAGAGALLEPERDLALRIRTALALLVPVYMIPDFYFPVHDLPSAPSGMTDKNALRSLAVSVPPRELKKYTAGSKQLSHASDAARPLTHEAFSSPQASQSSDKFVALQKAWSYVLGIPSPNREDHWFSTGGNSIKAMRLVAAARKEGLKITVADVFNNPVLADLELVASFGASEDSVQPKQLLQPRNESLFAQICACAPFLTPESIESAAAATDIQAWMLAAGEASPAGKGFANEFYVDAKDGLNIARLTKACTEVTRHHPLLRTILVQLEDNILQVVLKDQCTMLSQGAAFSRDATLLETITRKFVPRFSYENISPDGRLCHRLRLTLRHALYDGLYFQIVVEDITSAYCGRPLTACMPFHAWIANIGARDSTATKAFWKKTLLASSMTHLHPPSGPCRHESQSGLVRMGVHIEKLQSYAGTEFSVLKAAWATVLARELGVEDVVFGQTTANRSSSFLETDQIMGPCVNIVPIRVSPTQTKDFSQLVQEVHEQHRASIPHQDLGFRQIIRDCTGWPRWTRYGSCVIYQNYGSMVRESEGLKARIGDVEVEWSGHGEPADAGDIWVIAVPDPDKQVVSIELQYIPGIVSTEQAQRLARNLTTVLETGHLDPQTISPAGSAWSLVSDGELGNPTSPGRSSTRQSQELVSKAWSEVNLFRDGVLPEADASMFDCRADIVSALLFSRFYQRHGYDFGVADIVRNPTARSQALWLDEHESVEV